MATIRKSGRMRKPTLKAKILNKSSSKRISDTEVVSDDDEWLDVGKEECSTKMDTGTNKQEDLQWLLSRLSMSEKKQVSPTERHIGYQPGVVIESNEVSPGLGSGVIDPIIYLTGTNGSTQVHDICDFVNITPPMQLDVSSCSGPDEVLQEFYKSKTGSKRPILKRLQWHSGAWPIHAYLTSSSGKLINTTEPQLEDISPTQQKSVNCLLNLTESVFLNTTGVIAVIRPVLILHYHGVWISLSWIFWR